MPTPLEKPLTEKDFRRFHEFFESAREIEAWTPAMLAMLICGIRPVPDCQTIPDQAASILPATRAANKTELENARTVLKTWVEYHLPDYEEVTPENADELRRTPVEYMEFFIDCYECGLSAVAPLLMELIGLDSRDGTYLFTASKLAAKVHELETRKKWVEEQSLERLPTDLEQHDEEKNSSTDLLARQPDCIKPNVYLGRKTRPGRKNLLEALISAAEDSVEPMDKNNADVVYQYCLELAKKDPGICKRFVLSVNNDEDDGLYFTDNVTKVERNYPRRLIQQRIYLRQKKSKSNNK